MKKRILIFASVLLTLMFTLGLSTFAASAEESSPSVSIEKFNLAFENDTHLKYAVKFTGIEDSEINYNNIGMLYWTDYEGGFAPGTENYSSKTTGYKTIDEQKYYVFEYDNLAAKQLTDYIYSAAYIELEGITYYSEPVKYSALEYAYNRLGKTSEGTTNAELKALLNNMLTYGASAQEYFDYKEDRLATANFYQITLVDGTLPDGFTSGLYLATDEVTITAPTELDGKAFSAWQNSAVETVSTDNPAVISNLTANETYTATYTETSTYSEGLAYTLNDDGESYSVTGIGTCTDTEIIIPSTYEGKPVTIIGHGAFFSDSHITGINIPETVLEILCDGWYGNPFLMCSNLEKIEVDEANPAYRSIDGSLYTKDGKTLIKYASGKIDTDFAIPESVVNVGLAAFQYSMSLENVVIPDNVVDLGAAAFGGCINIKYVKIGSGVSNMSYPFLMCSNLLDVEISDDNKSYKSVDGNIYSKDETILLQYALGKQDASFIVPDKVITIGKDSFRGCTNLTSVVISGGVSSIDDYAFGDCANLVSVTIPESLTEIGESAFQDCTSLTSITIPENVTSIGESAFYKCTSLTSVYITSIEAWLNIPFSDQSSNPCYYGADLYLNGELLTQLIIPNSITSISSHAFSSCTSIITVSISDSVTSIEYGAFQNCTNLESVVLANGITRIRSFLFAGCTNLTSIVIPDSVTLIDNNVFDNCGSLTDIYYTGTKEAWSTIDIWCDSDSFSNATIHFNYVPEE